MRRDEGGAFGEGSGREGVSTSADLGGGGGSRVVAGALLETGPATASSKSALPHETHDDVPSIA